MPDPHFIQTPPRLGNQYRDDAFLRSYLARCVPPDVLARIESELDELGDLSGGELYQLQLQDRLNEPRLQQWDAWGNRIDHVELTALWRRAAQVAASFGLLALPYEQAHGRFSRLHQFAAVYLFHPSSDMYTCPLAMSDGAARTLSQSGNDTLYQRALPRLISRDAQQAWTSGQWMTEAIGGSDVSRSQTQAVLADDGVWRLYGKKWFTSAITSQIALTLARPQGNPEGTAGLAMFYVETRDAQGALNGLRVERLKDKLGTRKLPTAELVLDGARAQLVGDAQHGTRAIAPMLTLTRTWNAVTAVAFMRRALTLAKAYARERQAFGAPLNMLPLHADTLAGLEAQSRGAFLLAFEVATLIGREEAGELAAEDAVLLRLLTPIAKLLTARQAVGVISECLECMGGAGYVEDTVLPALLRDAQVLTIWEGTTNVLALDVVLRGSLVQGFPALQARIERCLQHADADARLLAASRLVQAAMTHVRLWLQHNDDPQRLQAQARRLAMTLGRTLELALLIEHAAALANTAAGVVHVAAVVRFAASRIDRLSDIKSEDSIRLSE